jgi:hypothetical protein
MSIGCSSLFFPWPTGARFHHLIMGGHNHHNRRFYFQLVGTRDGRTQSARACKPALLHLALRTWVSGPGQTHALSGPGFQDLDGRTKALHPTVVDRCSVLCLIFSRHFSLRPSSLFSASSGDRRTLFPASIVTFLCVQWWQTDRRTQQVTLYIRFATHCCWMRITVPVCIQSDRSFRQISSRFYSFLNIFHH